MGICSFLPQYRKWGLALFDVTSGVAAQASSALLTLQEQKTPDMLQATAMKTSPTKQAAQMNKPQPTPKKAGKVHSISCSERWGHS